MKRIILFTAAGLLAVLLWWYFTHFYGWMEFHRNTDTPSAYLNNVVRRTADYQKDSDSIKVTLHGLLGKHDGPFYPKDYFDSTQLIIDTIIYNPSFDKLVVFVITKNPTYRQLAPDPKYRWYYCGYCFLGARKNDSIELGWLRSTGYSGYHEEKEISDVMRSYYFREYAWTRYKSERPKYNMNDSRFWTSDVWREWDDSKERRRKFEKLKAAHPEDVYEPPQ